MGWIVGCWCLGGRFACRLASESCDVLVFVFMREGRVAERKFGEWRFGVMNESMSNCHGIFAVTHF